ncbi:MAG: cobyrinic acid a,c-diamide synthase [Anaeromassilibacillus sp.]
MFHREVLAFLHQSGSFPVGGGHGPADPPGTCAGSGVFLVGGAMGYYDGIGFTERAGSYDLARATRTPVVLIVDGRGAAQSLLAQVKGFLTYRADSRIAGVIWNRLSPSLYPALQQRLEQEFGIRSLGFLPKMDAAVLESRHLGLVTAAEVDELQQRWTFGGTSGAHRRFDGLLAVAQQAEPLSQEGLGSREGTPSADCRSARPGVLLLLCGFPAVVGGLGAELCPFSPLTDAALPPGCSGMLLGGGYPELHAAELERNAPMRESVRAAVQDGMPCVAECGGFLYLHRTLEDAQGISHQMVGAIAADGKRTNRLQRFGYATLTALRDNLLCKAGERIPIHEFHYWECTDSGMHSRRKRHPTPDMALHPCG